MIGQHYADSGGPLLLSVLSHLVQRMAAFELPADALLRGTGLAPGDMVSDRSCRTLVSGGQLLRVFHNALTLSGDPSLGLRLGAEMDVGVYGSLSYAMLSAATDIDAVNLAIRYQRMVVGDLARISLVLEGDAGMIRFNDRVADDAVRVCLLEWLLASFMRFNQAMTGRPVRLRALRLAWPDPGYRAHYEALFDCPVVFSAAHHDLVFDTRVLGWALPNADAAMFDACVQICDEMLALLDTGTSVSGQVRRLLHERWREAPDMPRVAQWLGCEERTLRRRLTEERSSFRALKDEVRSEVAIEQLRHSGSSIGDIAQALGFGDAANFRKAFVRWTGRYPSYYRR